MGNVTSNESKKYKFGSTQDPNSPRPGYYFKNKKIKYHSTTIELVPNEKIETFEKLKYGYAKSNMRVFYNGLPITSADPKTFKILNRQEAINIKDIPNLNSVLGMDSKNIYHKGKVIKKL